MKTSLIVILKTKSYKQVKIQEKVWDLGGLRSIGKWRGSQGGQAIIDTIKLNLFPLVD